MLLSVLGPTGPRDAGDDLRQPGRLLAVSGGSLGFQLTFFLAVRDVGVSTSTLIALGLAPVVLTAAHSVAHWALPSPRTSAVLFVAVLGLALVSSAGGADVSTAPLPLRGVVEAAASGLLSAASTAWSSVLSARMAITLTTSLVGVLVLLPVVALTGWQVPLTAVSVGDIVWLGVVATVVA